MKTEVDLWLEIVKERLAAGDSGITALLKANQVASAYRRNFLDKPPRLTQEPEKDEDDPVSPAASGESVIDSEPSV